jgi:thioredoxin-related protein
MISDESLEKISNFQKKNKYNFNFQKSNNPNESLGVFSLPTTYFFNDKGKKIETIVGVVDWDSKRFIEKLINL